MRRRGSASSATARSMSSVAVRKKHRREGPVVGRPDHRLEIAAQRLDPVHPVHPERRGPPALQLEVDLLDVGQQGPAAGGEPQVLRTGVGRRGAAPRVGAPLGHANRAGSMGRAPRRAAPGVAGVDLIYHASYMARARSRSAIATADDSSYGLSNVRL